MAIKDETRAPAKPTATKRQQKPAKQTGKQIKIRLVRSLIGYPQKQRDVIKGLGLRKIDSEVIRKDCPEIRGMVRKVFHLVKVEELDTK